MFVLFQSPSVSRLNLRNVNYDITLRKNTQCDNKNLLHELHLTYIEINM